jgi:amidophosphoribosyltransferase
VLGIEYKRHKHQIMRTECGIFAAIGQHIPAEFVLTGMRNIQHRGQDSYGLMSVSHGLGLVSEIKEFGLLPNSLLDLLNVEPSTTQFANPSTAQSREEIVLGHTRYSTVAATVDKEAIQPIELSVMDANSGEIVYIAFNGNLPNVDANMKRTLGIQELEGPSDTFLFRAIWQQLEKQKKANQDELGDLAVEFARYCITRIPGAYSCVVLVGNKLIGFRDKYGYKPLWFYWPRMNSQPQVRGFVSETVQLGNHELLNQPGQLDIPAGYNLIEVPPGSYIILDAETPIDAQPIINSVISLPRPELSRCSMEIIYFCQDSSLVEYDNLAVRDIKYRLGQQLAKEELCCPQGEQVPQVIYVPESSYNYALGYSRELGLEFISGAIKKIYNIRSFIESNTEARVGKIKRKFEFAFDLITAEDIILIDDSLVRGNTMNYILGQLRELRPELKVHIRIASPVIKDRCWFGIDIAERDELVWWQTCANLAALQKYLGVASIQYLSPDGLSSVLGPGYCQYCFGSESDANRRTLEW